jgi:SMODS and SLOG-associating 2TM effector domain 1/Protein of unknown function (DUF4231)
MSTSPAFASTWQQQRVWSTTANGLRRDITRARSIALGLVIAGALLQTAASQVPHDTVKTALRVVGILALAIVPVIRQAKLGTERVRDWIRARSVSEGLKAETYLYLMGVPPYAEADRDAKLLEQTQSLVDKAKDLAAYTALVEPAPSAPPQVTDIETYIEQRVNQEINDYYRLQARKMAQRVKVFRGVELFFSLIAALLGALAAAKLVPGLDAWVAVVTTAGTAVTAHFAASRYEYLVISYDSTAHRLEFLHNQWYATPDDRDREAFVRRCEEAISIENEAWMAEWARKETGR